MDHLEQAKGLYRKFHDPVSDLSLNDRKSLSLSIGKLIRTCLVQHGGVASLKYLPFIHVIQRTVAANIFEGEQAGAAFRTLEKYLVLLFGKPWKREFWRLKTYGGYFRTKVKAHLDNPEEILQLVGYVQEEEVTNGNCLVLDHCPDTEIVLNVAFDCQVAAEECQQIGEYYDKMKCVGLSLSNAMVVLLSGAPNDSVVESGVAMMPGRTMQFGQSGMEKQSVGRVGTPMEGAQTIMASGGMGMGIVMGASTMHQVTGVPATRPASAVQSRHLGMQQASAMPGSTPLSAPNQYTYPMAPDHHGVGLKVDLPQPGHQGRVAEIQYRSHPNSSNVAGSRASYASSSGGQSSGYGSGMASELSAHSSAYTASSAFTASSGYNSGMLPQSQIPGQNYVYLPHVRGGDQVDSPLVTASNSPRHSRPLPVPQNIPADFPYIDEEEPGQRNQFPEATHEEHLRESLRNLQTGPSEPYVSKTAVMMPPPSSVIVSRQSGDAVPVPYDDWQWFTKHSGVGHNTVAGTGGMMANRLQHAVHPAADVMRLPPSQPATGMAVQNPALVNTNSMMKRQMSPMESRQQRAQSSDYAPITAACNAASPIPSTVDRPLTNSNLSSGYVSHDNIRPASQPVYFPPSCSEIPFQQYANIDAGLSHPQKPTFAQKTALGRPVDKSALLSRQAQGSPTTILNNLDKAQQVRPHSAGRESSGTSSEVLIRDKGKVRAGHVRGSSLVTQQEMSQQRSAGVGRQSSQSMDLGKLKWRCHTCTMENSSYETICSACSKTRDAPELQFPGPGETKRACPACTFENPSGCSKCEMCSNPLSPDVHTYV